MKAITVRQPHAQLIALGVKTIETRSWATKYRGPLVIHAGTKLVPQKQGNAIWHEPSKDWITFRYGAIVGTCNLVDVVPIVHRTQPRNGYCLAVARAAAVLHGNPMSVGKDITDQLPYGDFSPGRYAWLLEDIKLVEQRCPMCWGRSAYHDEYNVDCCAVCECQGTCDPIPARGKQGIWTWNP